MSGYDVTEPRLRCVLPFEAAPTEVRLLRRIAVRQLNRWGMPAAIDEAELFVTELATNVIKHVGEGTTAALVLECRGERVRVEVHDRGSAMPLLKEAGCDEECGRGLHLLGSLAADWGVVLTAAGKAVWCEISAGPNGHGLRVSRAVEAIEAYRRVRTAVGPQGRGIVMEETAIELIADLLHWTTARGQDPDDILDRAQMHYEAEADAA